MIRKILIGLLSVVTATCFAMVGFLAFNLFGEGFPGKGSHFDPKAIYYELDVDVTEGGSVNVTDGKYEKDQVVNLSASVEEGYLFMGWYDSDDNYITSSLDYTFAMTSQTKLYAKFCEKPEDIEGVAAYREEIKDCANDFSFTIKTGKSKSWLEENLEIIDEDLIGTEYEDDENAKVDFEVISLGGGEFLIKPNGKYDDGATYTARLKKGADGDIEIKEDDDQGETLTFSIKQEETDVTEEKEGIVYISLKTDVVSLQDDGKAEGDEGDIPDYVITRKRMGIDVGTIICIYSGEKDANGNPAIDEKTIFGKCSKRPLSNAGGYKVEYSAPELEEIYSDLDIYLNEEIDFEEAGLEISDEVIEEIKYAFLSQENFQLFLGSTEEVVRETIEGTDLEIEELALMDIVDAFNLSVDVDIDGTDIVVKIKFSGGIPIKKNKIKVAEVSLSFENVKTIKVNTIFNYKIKKVWFIPVGLKSYDFGVKTTTTDQYKYAINVNVDKGSFSDKPEVERGLKKDVLTEKILARFKDQKNNLRLTNPISQIFKDAGYNSGSRREIKLASFTHYFSVISFNIDVRFFVDFDFGGSAYYTTTTSSYSTAGIRSSGGAGKVYNEKGSSQKTGDLIFEGHARVGTGFSVNGYISVLGLSKYVHVGVGIEIGVALEANGFVACYSGIYAGSIEGKVFFNGYVFYKIFSFNGRVNLVSDEFVLFRYGYSKTLMNWTEYKKVTNSDYELSLVYTSTDLFGINDLFVNVYSAGGNISKQKLDYSKVNETVTFKDGKYLEYKDGRLIVKDNAPLYFEDTMTISVKSNNKWGAFNSSDYCSYLPTITVNITYGDEDAYYAASDSKIEASFRNMYRSYNEGNVSVLKEMLNNLIDGEFGEAVEDIVIFDVLVNAYVDDLFEVIKEYKAQDSGKDRTLENKFVYAEANAFIECMTWIKDMLDDESYDSEELRKIILDVENTEVLYRMLIDVKNNEKFSEFVEKFNLDEERKVMIKEDLEWFKANATNKQRAEEIVNAFYEIFSLGEEQDG